VTDDDLNEDWLKTLSWDFWNPDGTPIARFSQMWPEYQRPLSWQQLQSVQHFTELPAWLAAPAKLKRETDAILAEATIVHRIT
jgi:hypothetical protein